MNLDAVGIIVEDIPKAIAFYGKFGLTFAAMGGEDHYEAVTPSGVRIMLDSVALIQKLNPDWRRPEGSGVVLCFLQGSPAGVDRLFEELTMAGGEPAQAPWDAFWGQRYASVRDPDGNQVDLFAPLT